MLSYPATISLSSRTLNHLTERIHGHRQQLRGERAGTKLAGYG